MTTLIELVGPV